MSLGDTDGTQSASPMFSGTKGEKDEEKEGAAVTADGCKVSQQDSTSSLDYYRKVYRLLLFLLRHSQSRGYTVAPLSRQSVNTLLAQKG